MTTVNQQQMQKFVENVHAAGSHLRVLRSTLEAMAKRRGIQVEGCLRMCLDAEEEIVVALGRLRTLGVHVPPMPPPPAPSKKEDGR